MNPPVAFRLTIEYDGGEFHGWQRQKRQRTVQEELERAVAVMTGQRVSVQGSGRTDAGVHALGQVAGFRCRTRIEAPAFQRGLNSLLPDDIVVRDCRRAPDSFHARYDALRKLYRYRIRNRALPSAIGRRHAWHIRRPLDAGGMSAAAAVFVGRHDFSAFEGSGSPRAHSVRTVFRAQFTSAPPPDLVFEIEADGFLRFMVRNIVGTLVEVGSGKRTPEDCRRIMHARDRRLAGPTAPPQGLFLVRVTYAS